MKIFSKLAVFSFSLILLAGCESTGGASGGTISSGGWQGWTSVLQILEKAMVSDDGRQLATMQDFQTRLITPQSSAPQDLPTEVLADLGEETATSTVTAPVPPAAGATSGTIEVILFARGRMNAVKIRDVPLNGLGEPTAASASKIRRAALAFKDQIFGPNAQPMTPVVTEEEIIDQLLSQ